jgi:hypothetical protein
LATRGKFIAGNRGSSRNHCLKWEELQWRSCKIGKIPKTSLVNAILIPISPLRIKPEKVYGGEQLGQGWGKVK